MQTTNQMMAALLSNNPSYNLGQNFLRQGTQQAVLPGQAIGNSLTTLAGLLATKKGREEARTQVDDQNKQLGLLLQNSGFAVPDGVDPGMALPILQAKSQMDQAKAMNDFRVNQAKYQQGQDKLNYDLRVKEAERDQQNMDRRFGFQEARAAAGDAQDNRNYELALRKADDARSTQQAALDLKKSALDNAQQAKANKDQDQMQTRTTNMRKEYTGMIKNANVMNENYSKMLQAANDPSAAGDISLIFAYMKMLDPQSVVREGEFATAENSGGVPEAILNMYNKARDGTRLQPEQRLDFLNQARAQYQGAMKIADNIDQWYTGLAQDAGIDPTQVIMPRPEFGGQYDEVAAKLGGGTNMAASPDGIDPELWAVMSPEEKLLWQN
ncbi:hypothetical protein [Thalassospira marina]|uniref:Uncharacterized protein n=1 Tax=Thalassospira marina TaxID=2048283 RepID=A0A2N3KY39_9PROT|nr:hypothetical protein [Thalassospira marina]PKR55400.1 hypothetical protein COO20_04315 [Thalassospira marina]